MITALFTFTIPTKVMEIVCSLVQHHGKFRIVHFCLTVSCVCVLAACLFWINSSYFEIRSPDSKWIFNSSCEKCFSASYTFSIDIPSLCQGDVTLVIVIQVSPDMVSARDIIRQTWLSEVINTDRFKHVRFFFMLGQPGSDQVRRAVVEESKKHGDIVVAEFNDTYRNLTLKTVISFNWISSHCAHAEFFLKTDDDVWVDVTNLLSTLNSSRAILGHSLGGVCRAVKVNRDNSSKWFVSPSEFPHSVYDSYCSGTGYVGGIQIAKGVAAIYNKVPYFHLEDVYVGMCLKALGYSTIFLPHFDNIGGPNESDCSIKAGGFVLIHKVPAHRMTSIQNATCSRVKSLHYQFADSLTSTIHSLVNR